MNVLIIMEKTTTKFGMGEAIIINDLSLKSKIIDFLFNSIDLSEYRYNMLNNLQRLQFLRDNEHYVTPNFLGYNYLLLFLTIDKVKYCVAIDKKRLSYHKNQVVLKKVFMYKLLINALPPIFKGTIFDCKLINSITFDNQKKIYKYYMLLKDCYLLSGTKIIDMEMKQKITHIDNIIKTQFTTGSKCKNFNFKINKLETYENLKDLIEKKIPSCGMKVQGLVFYPKFSGVNVVFLEKHQEKIDIIANYKSDDTIEAKSYDLIVNMTNYLKCRNYSYEINGKSKKLWLQNTNIPDVYNVYEEKDENKLGIAHIPNLKISHMCKEKICNESVRFNCRFDKEFKKWIPLNPA